MAQPTWEEMQNVCRGVSGMYTASTREPSARASSSFAVPSSERSDRCMAGVEQDQRFARSERNAAGRSVICATSVTLRRYSQRAI